ncbi:MAG: hypothetical protein PF505_04835 [Vallitaleaceae bacterium]|nr:hypothetical protein [Vallitaleaceae bacterium]
MFPKEEQKLIPAIIEIEATTYETILAQRGYIEDTDIFHATAEPITRNYQYISSEGSHYKEGYVTLGDAVEIGDLLFELDTGHLLDDIQLKELAVNTASVDYEAAIVSADINQTLEEEALDSIKDELAELLESFDESVADSIALANTRMEDLQDSYDKTVLNYEYMILQKELAIKEATDSNLSPNQTQILEVLDTDLANTRALYNIDLTKANNDITSMTNEIAGLEADLSDPADPAEEAVIATKNIELAALQATRDKIIMNYNYLVLQKELAIDEAASSGVDINRTQILEILNMDLANTKAYYDIDLTKIADDMALLDSEIEELESEMDDEQQKLVEALTKSIDTKTLEIQLNTTNRNNTLNMKKNALEADRLQLQELYNQRDNSMIYAETAGTVFYIKTYEEGDIVDAYVELVGIADMTTLIITLRPRYSDGELDVSQFILGDKITIEYNDDNYIGTVVGSPTYVPEDLDDIDTTQGDGVYILFDNQPDDIESGDRVTITILVASSDDTIIIPKDALLETGMGYLVYVLEEGRKTERYVQVGIMNDLQVEIVDGLDAGEEIVLN